MAEAQLTCPLAKSEHPHCPGCRHRLAWLGSFWWCVPCARRLCGKTGAGCPCTLAARGILEGRAAGY